MTNTGFAFFAQWMGASILDQTNQRAGRLWDFEINPQEQFPSVTALVLYRPKGFTREYAEVPWSAVDSTDGNLRLKIPAADLRWIPRLPADVFRIRKDVLDQQVVDTYKHKVIRVNDVHLIRVNPWRIVHVDIGTRGLVRRLGYTSVVDTLVRVLRPHAKYLTNDYLVSWKYVKTISLDPKDPIHIDLTANQLASILPADLGEILMDLDIHQRVALLRTAPPQQRARLFEGLDFDQQAQLLEHLTKREVVELVSQMSADEAVDLLGDMPSELSREFLSMMESTRAKKLSQLLGYEEDEAGGIMTTEYLEIPRTSTVQQAINLVKEKTANVETIYYLYVVSESKQLIGTTTLRQLISASPEAPVMQTVFPKPLFVYLHTSLKEVAFLMDKYKVSALPVVNKERVLQGIITVDDVLHNVIPIAWRRKHS